MLIQMQLPEAIRTISLEKLTLTSQELQQSSVGAIRRNCLLFAVDKHKRMSGRASAFLHKRFKDSVCTNSRRLAGRLVLLRHDVETSPRLLSLTTRERTESRRQVSIIGAVGVMYFFKRIIIRGTLCVKKE